MPGIEHLASLGDGTKQRVGEKMHQNLLESWLSRLGLTEDHLACGAVLPEHTKCAHRGARPWEKSAPRHPGCRDSAGKMSIG